MSDLADIVLVIVAAINLSLLGSSRITLCIWLAAWQGVALGALPLLVAGESFSVQLVLLAAVMLTMKGLVFPRLLFRSLRTANVRRELIPLIGYTASVGLGVSILLASLWLSTNITLPNGIAPISTLVIPIALATLLTGLLLIISRQQAITQVVGYLVLENGVFVFGVALAHGQPLLVEMGILLDVFGAVLVMGIAAFHIHRSFDRIDVEQLSQLKF